MCRSFVLTSLLSLVFFVLMLSVSSAAQRKILYVDSYHEGYPWSAGITRGVQSVLDERQDIELRIERMDTKRNSTEEFKESAALKIKQLIDSWQPDVVIASDDNASKYLIVPYYVNGQLPFVFCGVNGDVSGYGFPAANVTGMIEVQLIGQIIDTLQNYSAGQRVAFIKGDDLSARKEAAFFEKHYSLQIDKRFVADFTTWKTEYLALQKEADMILLGNSASVEGWNAEEALALVMAKTTVPTGNWDAWMAPYSLLTLASKPEEQGQWAAVTALQILSGTVAGDIPVATNQKGKVYLNMELAKKLGIKFPIELIERATFISELGL